MEQLIQFIRNLWTETIAPSWKSISNKSTKDIVDAIKQKQNARDISINNPDDISVPIVEALGETQKAIEDKSNEVTVLNQPVFDVSELSEKMSSFIEALNKKDLNVKVGKTKIHVDTKAVVKAVERLQEALPELKPQEQVDYTLMFDEMMKIMEKPKDQSEIIKLQELTKKLGTSEDLSSIADWLKVIAEKEVEQQELPVKDGRILVSVDKVGGGGGGLTQIETDYLSNISNNTATSDPLAKYKFADLDDDASPNYYGATDSEGNWYILKEDTSAKTLRYATGDSDYTTNWTGRVSLTYQYLYNVTIY